MTTIVAQFVNGLETRYTLDVAASLEQVLVEQRSDVATTYLYGLGRIAYRTGTAEWHYYLADGLGNVRAEVSAAGVLLTVRRFSPFGEPLQGGDGGTPFGYTGQQWDASAGLLYLRARYYSPVLGRFVSRDPWPGYGAAPQSLNRYAYVINNPVNLTDPRGLWPPDRWLWKYVPGNSRDWLRNYYKDLAARTQPADLDKLTDYYYNLPAKTRNCGNECYDEEGKWRNPSAWQVEPEVILLAKMLRSESPEFFAKKYPQDYAERVMTVAAWTVMNRVENRGQSVREILLDPGDYTGLTAPHIEWDQVKFVCDPDKDKQWRRSIEVAVKVYYGLVPDPTGGHEFFGDYPDVEGVKIRWHAEVDPTDARWKELRVPVNRNP